MKYFDPEMSLLTEPYNESSWHRIWTERTCYEYKVAINSMKHSQWECMYLQSGSEYHVIMAALLDIIVDDDNN